jgi:hypothetical protein
MVIFGHYYPVLFLQSRSKNYYYFHVQNKTLVFFLLIYSGKNTEMVVFSKKRLRSNYYREIKMKTNETDI